MADNDSSTIEPVSDEVPIDEEQTSPKDEPAITTPDELNIDGIDVSLEEVDDQEDDEDDLPVDSRESISEYTLPLLPNDPLYDVSDSFDESALNELLSTPGKEIKEEEAVEEEYVSFGQQGASNGSVFLQEEPFEEEEVDDEEDGDEEEDMALMDPDNVRFCII
jgi:hypothetical protein